jgi:hypothetical protein
MVYATGVEDTDDLEISCNGEAIRKEEADINFSRPGSSRY